MNKPNIQDRVRLIKDEEISWDWDTSSPQFNTVTPNARYGMHLKFDPFPCYSHQKELVIQELKNIESLFPIGFPVFIFLFPYESVGRTNGQAYCNTVEYADLDKGIKGTWDGVIDLYGKRIPIHPRMTKYLCHHEYGHLVDDWICNQKGLSFNGLDEEYAKMRGIDLNQKYGGRKWHTNIGEILVNDFRICISNTEPEFWPHECKHPLECQNVIDFWKEMKEKYSYKNEIP